MKHTLLILYIFLNAGLLLGQGQAKSSSWQQILDQKQGTIVCYWFDTEPFIYQTQAGLEGIEVELMEGFVNYLEKKYRVNISIQWVKVNAFGEVYETIRKSKGPAFGITAISYTPERKRAVNFTPSYMADISVIVTGRSVPYVNSLNEFNAVFAELDAYTLQGSTIEKFLIDLRLENNLDFKINYVPRMSDLIEKVGSTPNSFAYIDLPTYLVALEKNKQIKRQFFHPVKLHGYGFIYPKITDWEIPVNDYFTSEEFRFNTTNILNKHLGPEVVSLVNELSMSQNIGSSEEIMILSKEQEFRNQELMEITLRSEQRKMMRNLFIGGFIFLLLVALLLLNRYKIKSKANQALGQQQRKIKKRNKMLEELNEEKNNLLRVVSHDIRNPVNQISGFANLIKMEGNYLREDHAELIDKIIATSDRINQMASKVLDIESLEAENSSIKLEKVDIKKLLEEVLEGFSGIAARKNIELQMELEKDLFDVLGDETYVVQVFQNLISNAVKFSEAGSKVKVQAFNKRKYVELQVIDEGPGIQQKEMHLLFKKFQRLSSRPTAGEPSTGLGLSIVKKYVTLMKGSVKCTNNPDKGATFSVRLLIAPGRS